MTPTLRLQAWYARQCDGLWEHHHGIEISSLDNPGWSVKIDLLGTALAGVPFESIAENVDADRFQTGPRWLVCDASADVWDGAGDETTLERILELFVSWAERQGT